MNEWEYKYHKQQFRNGCGRVERVDSRSQRTTYEFTRILNRDGSRRLVETGTIEFEGDVLPIFERVRK